MTKEALEKEADDYVEQIRVLQKQNVELKEELEQVEKVKVVEHFEAYGQCRDSRRIAQLEAQIEKMKVCQNCNNWNWKHNECEKKLKGDCFKHSKWVMRNF